MKLWEVVFLFIGDCLGAHIFKKYWPKDGSYWNDRHINKNNIGNLKKIIQNAHTYIQWHMGGLAIECITYTGVYFIGDSKYLSLLFVGIGVHLYAFMINRYNIIRARHQLEQIRKKSDIQEEEIQFIDSPDMYFYQPKGRSLNKKFHEENFENNLKIKAQLRFGQWVYGLIYQVSNPKKYKYVTCLFKDNTFEIKPFFESFEQALKYRKLIEAKFEELNWEINPVNIHHAIYLDLFKSLVSEALNIS